MRITKQVHTAFQALVLHKVRSMLTILGIVIGIAAIMAMMSIGQGAENLILGEINGLGAETVVIRPGKEPSGPSDFGDTLFADSIREREHRLISNPTNVPDIRDTMPVLAVSGSASYQGETYRPTIIGGDAEFFSNTFDVFPEFGTNFDEADIRSRAGVVVIGPTVEEELFGTESALGKRIRIKDKTFRVVGIYPKVGQKAFFNFDELVIMPYSTAQTYILGISHYNEIIVKLNSSEPEVVERAVYDIEQTLREAHDITNPDDDDFYVETQQGLVDQVQTILGTLTAFLTSVVAIALVVGGIGIMNIMLVSVTERTREIGLRKALGATEKDILTQFLLEAVLLTAFGGIIGILLGGLISFLAALVLTYAVGLNWEFVFPISAAVLGVSMSAVVGLIFGIYPARKAAQKSPIEALRYE